MADRIPAIQALRAFETVARTGSLTKASQLLNLTHSAISHQIKSIEADFGIRLLERVGRGVRLTEDGERFAARVRAALEEIADALREIRDRGNREQLRISVVPSFAARWLLPRIGDFISAHPDIDLDISSTNALVDFRNEKMDLAIRDGLGAWKGTIAVHLMDDWFFPVCSATLAHGRLPKQPADLTRHVLLRSDGESWAPWFRAAGLDWNEPRRGPRFSDSSHLLQAAVDGQGIALARQSLLGNDLREGRLVRLFDIAVKAERSYYLVQPPLRERVPKVEAFKRWIVGEVERSSGEPQRGVARARSKPRRAPRES